MIKSNSGGSYWLVYGFAEGPGHARHFNAAMRAAGFIPAPSMAEANLVLAHSGGCFALPPLPGKIVVLCQPASAWQESPERILVSKTGHELRRNRQLGRSRRYLDVFRRNIIQLLVNPQHSRRIVRLAADRRRQLPDIDCARLIAIISRDDPWSRHISLTSISGPAAATYLGLPGTHDELWTHPEALVASLRKVLHET